MNDDPRTRYNRPVSDQLHSGVYVALVGAAMWFALAIWGFAADRYTDWLLVIVSAFTLIAVSIPAILSAIEQDDGSARRDARGLRDWLSSDFASWTGRSKASNAAAEVLLPLGAIAVGMTAFAIVFIIAEHTS